MLNEEALEALGARYKSTGGVGTFMWKRHQLVLRHPTVDEWDAHLRTRAADLSGGPVRQLAQILLVAFDGETDVMRARAAFGAFLSAGNAAFPNAPEWLAFIAVLAGTAQEEDIAHMGEAVRLWTGAPTATPAASPNGSGTAPVVGTASATTDVPLRS